MKLVFLYGPPGVGKLTVATELARLTGFKLWDNHKSIDAIASVFRFGTEPFGRLRDRIREMVLEEAAVQEVDLIYTMAYAHPDDIPYVARMLSAYERRNAEVCFVQLTCGIEENERRLVEPSRANKLHDLDIYRTLSEVEDFWTPIPDRDSLQIDNTGLSPRDAAIQIVEHYKLPVGGSF